MKTLATFAFFFYVLWGPAFTIGFAVFCFRKLEARSASIPWFMLAVAFMSLVAGPVVIDGPLPGPMPWWAYNVIAHDQHVRNLVIYYALFLSVVFAAKYLLGAKEIRPDADK